MQALETQLAPTYYDDPKGALFKLTQREVLLSCFIFGLSLEIRREVLTLQPISLPQATALAKLQEDKIQDRRRVFKPPHPNPNPPHPFLPLPNPRQPFVHRTPEEMALRREKGLCYNCDEKWNSSHRCHGCILLLIADTKETQTTTTHLTDPDLTDPPDPDNPTPTISLHASSSISAPATFRIYGFIGPNRLTVLIDSGSTHNFIQPWVAKYLSLPLHDTPLLRIMVGNSSILKCHQRSDAISLSLQNHAFSFTLHLLPISGADVVLGVVWLKQLGPVVIDYTTLSMKFHHLGLPAELRTDVPVGPLPTSPKHL